MYALEFETDITDKFIEIKNYEKVANKHARVIILVTESPIKATKVSVAGDLKKYANPKLITNEKELAWDLMTKGKNEYN